MLNNSMTLDQSGRINGKGEWEVTTGYCRYLVGWRDVDTTEDE